MAETIIVAVAGPTDDIPQDGRLVVPFDVPGHPNRVSDSTRDVLAENDLAPSALVHDLLRLAMVAYVGDMRVSRSDAYDAWTRRFRVDLFVSDPGRWESVRTRAEAVLNFLTGDDWTLSFRAYPSGYTPKTSTAAPKRSLRVPTISLLSGGLDSFVGAIDLLSDGAAAFAAHHGGGGGATSVSQAAVQEVLRSAYDDVSILQFWFAPPHIAAGVSETTTRGRSFLFISLGVAAAAAAGATRLVIPENGVISLNVPLTSARLGSLSTRTTHPHYIALMRDLLAGLEIDLTLDLPYRFATKGEMLQSCRNQEILKEGLPLTMSCSHPDSLRFREKNPHIHCGRCIPCLIRRAATHAWAVPDDTDYATADLRGTIPGKSGADLRAVRIALDRYSRRQLRISDILSAGPLPVSDADVQNHLDVFIRGIDELRAFLKQYPED